MSAAEDNTINDNTITGEPKDIIPPLKVSTTEKPKKVAKSSEKNDQLKRQSNESSGWISKFRQKKTTTSASVSSSPIPTTTASPSSTVTQTSTLTTPITAAAPITTSPISKTPSPVTVSPTKSATTASETTTFSPPEVTTNVLIEPTTITAAQKPLKSPCFGVCDCVNGTLIDCSSRNLTNENLPEFSLLISQMDKATQLNLSNNQLEHIDAKIWTQLAELKKLEVVDLSHNKINSIDGFSQALTPKIIKLDLSHNELKTMKSNVVLNNAMKLSLEGNPWHCACRQTWMKNLAPQISSTVRCMSPQQYREVDYLNIFNHLPECDRSINPTNSILLFLSVMAIITAVLALFMVLRNGLHDRLFRSHQYGTVYYTKADFSSVDTL